MRRITFALALAGLPAFSAQGQDASDLCAKFSRSEPQIFSGAVLRNTTLTSTPISMKKGAVLLTETYDLKTDWLTVSDANLSTEGGTRTPIEFRLFLINGVRQYCAEMARDNIFGTWPGPDNYFLRCLVDKNGDGKYEAFHRYGELVPYNMRSGKAGPPSGETVQDRPLAVPVTLIPLASVPTALSKPVALIQVSISGLTATEARFRLAAKMGDGPDDEKFRSYDGGKGIEQTVALQDGSSFQFNGYVITLHQDRSKWGATTQPAAGPSVKLLCSGSIVEAAGDYSLFFAGGRTTLDGNSVRTSNPLPAAL